VLYSPPRSAQPPSGSNLTKSPGFVPREKVISPVMSISRLLSDSSSEQQSEEQSEKPSQQPAREFVAQPPPRSSAFHATNAASHGYSTNQDVERSPAHASMSSSAGPVRHNGINDLLNHGSESSRRSSQSSEQSPHSPLDPKVRNKLCSRTS
jgi:hypothetical protein